MAPHLRQDGLLPKVASSPFLSSDLKDRFPVGGLENEGNWEDECWLIINSECVKQKVTP